MKLTVLGSGVCIIKDRKGPSYLIDTSDQLILLDCGWGFGENLLKSGYSPLDIDHICISHPHADHMGGLINILQSIAVENAFFPEKKRTKPLHLHGYTGFKKDYEKLRDIMFPERMEEYEIKIYEYLDDKQSFGEIAITGKEVKHNPHLFHSTSFRVEQNGKSIVYSGDSSYDEALIELSKDADFAVFEASTPPQSYIEHGARPNHLSPYEAGKIAEKAGVKQLGLTHIYHDLTTIQEVESEVRKEFTNPIYILNDLDTFEM